MGKLTSRDYKKSSRRSLDLGRHRQFGYGLLVGAVLAGVTFAYLGEARHKGPDRKSVV